MADVLTDLFVVLLAAKIGDKLFRRVGQPTIVGEILAAALSVAPGSALGGWGCATRPSSASA